MLSFRIAAFLAAALLLVPSLPVRAENQMGYRLLSVQEAANLPRKQGALGLDVDRAQQITDGGMTFFVVRVKQVKRNSAGARAGFKVGDQIIALNGRVFPTLAAFAAYIASTEPGSQMMVDYMPAGTGPEQAQRLTVIVGEAGRDAPMTAKAEPEESTGMSTGTKVAIGTAAVALLGCYKLGCFSRGKKTNQPQQPNAYQAQRPNGFQPQQPNAYQPNAYQQRQ